MSTEVASALVTVSLRVARGINVSAIDSHLPCDAEVSPISTSLAWSAGASLTNPNHIFISVSWLSMFLESLGTIE